MTTQEYLKENGFDLKAKIITDIEEIAKVEAMGTWEDETQNLDDMKLYDIWSFNGQLYAIAKHKDLFGNDD